MQPRARARISVDALRHNLEVLSERAGAPVLLPVKADAYGHGAPLVARATAGLPQVWGYGVATPGEALELASLSLGKPTLLLTPAAPEELAELAGLGVRVTVSTLEEARALPKGARAHLKINTGMNRLGVRPEAAPGVARELEKKGVLEGIFTHFASSEGPDLAGARGQLEIFRAASAKLPPALRHASNSGAVFNFGPEAAFDLIRPGIAAYGYAPDAHLRGQLPLRPALRLEARVNHVHTVPVGESVSYGALWTATQETEVAVIGMGYADGYPRPATGRAQISVRGKLRPVLGRICMDQVMLDVTGLGVRPGEWVELLGPGGVDADRVAEWAGTISYEVLTGLGRRIERTLAP